MLAKIVSLIAAFIMLFVSSAPLPTESSCLVENAPAYNAQRVYDEINGAKDTRFYIQRPKADALNEVNAAEFGLDENSNDNYAAFQKALDYCRANSGTKLVINKGTYYFRTAQSLTVDNCRDLFVEGNGATFIFSDTINSFVITGSECVEFNNLICDWNREERPIESIVTVKNVSRIKKTVDLEFNNKQQAREDVEMMVFTKCDPDGYTFGAKEADVGEIHLNWRTDEPIKSITKVSDDTLRIEHKGLFNGMKNGDKWILRHFNYQQTVFRLTGASRDITFDTVKIYGSAGMAFTGGENISHFQFKNVYIGVNPDYADKYFVSCASDAMHFANTNGCFNIENCDISRQGDDSLNVHDGLGYITAVDGNKVTMRASNMRMNVGDTLAFKSEQFVKTDVTAKIVDVKTIEGEIKEVTLDTDVSDKIFSGYVAYSMECDSSNYVVKNNYFHEHRARALLLQSSNGLVENNRFYKIMGYAIAVCMDIVPNSWQEGTGVDNLIIRNNTFEKCSFSDWADSGAVINIDASIKRNPGDKKAETPNATIFTNIEISGNKFIEMPSYALYATNVNGLTFEDNTIYIGNTFTKKTKQGRVNFGKSCNNITYTDNVWTAKLTKNKQIAESNKIKTWAEVNSQLR